MLCECGLQTETRIGHTKGLIHGCWSHNHLELLDITDKDRNTIETVYDIIPRCGIECMTEEHAIETYEMYNCQ